jgi:uncharacterized protein (TIGR03089 family)
MSHPVDLLRRSLATEPSRPLITFYDDDTGERVELSARTFDNWVAKTANLLVDGLGAEPGGRVALALPAHWQTAVWLFACWSAGLTVLPVGDGAIPADADIVAAAPDRLAAAMATTAEVVGLSLHALGAPLADCPPGVTDYALEVRAYGDHFVPEARGSVPEAHGGAGGHRAPAVVSGGQDSAEARGGQESALGHHAPAVVFGGQAMTGAELMAEARVTSAAARVLTTVSFDTPDGLLAGFLSPLASGGSVIICQNLAQKGLERRISLEHVTAVVPPRSTHPSS